MTSLRCLIWLVAIVLGNCALPAMGHAYDSAEMIIHTAKREGRPLGTRRWALEPQRCRRLIDFTGTAEQCTVHATANGMAAIVSLVTVCGGDVCDGKNSLSIAKAKPLLLPDALWGGGLELLPSLRALVADHVDLNGRARRVEANLVQYDLKTASTTRFAACESPTLSPQGRWIVCRHADGDVFRVSVKGGRPQHVFRTQVKPAEAYRAPHSWALHPPVEFPTPTQMRIPTQLQSGELRTEQAPWTE